MSTPSIKELRQARAREGKRAPKWLRWLVVAAAVFAMYLVIGFFIAPPVVRTQVEKRLSAALGREVTAGRVALNPLTLSGAIEDFVIRERDGKQAFVAWRRAFANFDSWSLFKGEWRFDEVTLDGASGRVTVDREGRLNLADIVDRINTADTSQKPGEPRPLRIGRLVVSDARFEYREDSQPRPFATTVGPVGFSLRDFHTGGKNRAPGEFFATTEAGETIAWRGTLAVAPLRSSGDFSLGNVVLKKYMPFVARFAKFEIADGTLALKSHYELVLAGDEPELRVQQGALTLTALKIAAPGGAEPAIALDSVEVSGVAANSKARTAEVARVALTGGRITATRDAEGIDLLRLLRPLNADGAGASMAVSTGAQASGRPLDARLGELAVNGLSIIFSDTTTPRPVRQELEGITLNAKDVALSDLAARSPVSLGVALAGGGAVRISGAVAARPLAGDVTVDVENVTLAGFSPYVESLANVRIAQGAVSMKGHVVTGAPAGAGEIPAITVHADASVSDVAVRDAGDGELAGWKALVVRGVEAVTAPGLKLLVADIEWIEPRGNVIVNKNGALNLTEALAGAGGGRDAGGVVTFDPARRDAPVANAPAAFVAVDRFQLRDGTFTFLDRSMEPEVVFALKELEGNIAGLSSAALARADVSFKGQVNDVGTISIRGQVNPLATDAFTDLDVEMSGVDLGPAAPYVARYAGYQLERGRLTLDVEAKLADRRLASTTAVTLDPFTLGEKTASADATKLPVKLGLAILRDRNGRIALPPVAVDGNLDDPNFRVGRVIWYAIGNIFTKAATSPFAFLGSVFGAGKGEELAYQEFAAGSAELRAESLKKLEVVGRILGERPGLRLEIAGAYSASVDTPALRERELEKGLRAALAEELRRRAPAGAAVAAPEDVTLTPDDAARLTAMFYRAAFEPKAEEAPDTMTEVMEQVEKDAAAEEQSLGERKRALAPVVRQFRRGGAPVSSPRAVAPKAPPPRPFTTTRVATSDSREGEAETAKPAGPSLAEMRARLLAAIPIDEMTLRQLAGERARTVRQHLVESAQIAEERLAITGETAKGARVDLQLK